MIDLRFERVSKVYRVRQEAPPGGGGHPLVRRLRALRARRQEFHALRDVSFGVERGEALGIIGHNGAGKSTILKLLSNITAPSSGEITINGRLSALIEVGTGFHPELTGRENVYLSGSILGMRRAEIAAKLDRIVDFAGVRQFIDTPVKRYSSGMYVRLGFSIAAHLDPDILLLDEVLAVGDAAFQQRCLQRIDELKRGGKTIVFVSHDLGAVERLCDRVILLQRGEVYTVGRPREVVAEYQRMAASLAHAQPPGAQVADDRPKRAENTALDFYDESGARTQVFQTGGGLTARMQYTARARVKDAVFGIFFYSESNELKCQFSTACGGEPIDLEPGEGVVEFTCPELGLLPGAYHIDTAIEQYPEVVDWKYRCATLRVDPGKIVRGEFYMPHGWRLEPEAAAVGVTPGGSLADSPDLNGGR
jgi:ABC-type polysaccharide/polyol phosphate transport system ATPase subunit